jgi:hypothetical protein
MTFDKSSAYAILDCERTPNEREVNVLHVAVTPTMSRNREYLRDVLDAARLALFVVQERQFTFGVFPCPNPN